MINLLHADAFTASRSRVMWLIFLASAAMASGYFWFAHSFAATTPDSNTVGAASMLSDTIAVFFLGSLVVGQIVSDDFDSRAIHDKVLAERRGTFVVAKSLSAAVLIGVVVLPYLAISLGCFISGEKFVNFLGTSILGVAANPDNLSVDASSVTGVLAVGLVVALNYAAQLAFCVPVAFWTKRPIAVVAIGFIGGFFINGLSAQSGVPSAVVSLLDFTPYGSPQQLSLSSSGSDLVVSAVVSVVFVGLMAVLSWFVMRRADLK